MKITNYLSFSIFLLMLINGLTLFLFGLGSDTGLFLIAVLVGLPLILLSIFPLIESLEITE